MYTAYICLNQKFIVSIFFIQQAELGKLSHEELLALCIQFFSTRISLLHDHIARQQGNSPPVAESQFATSWCKCGRCREMPTQKERKCCGKRHCITRDRSFMGICVDGLNLEVAIRSRSDIYVAAPRYDNASMRHTGYCQFVMWQHGPLGAGNRVVIPSCAVNAICRQYPSANGLYTGYKDSH